MHSNGGEAEQERMGVSWCCQRSSPPPPKARTADRGISYLWKPTPASNKKQGEEEQQQQQGSMTKDIKTNDELKEVLRQAKQPNSKLVVLEFTATWSEPCKFMRPAVAEIAAHFKDNADFYTLDVDKFKTFARNTRVEALPTFLLVRSTILERVVGVSKDDLQRSIHKHILTSIHVD